MVEKAMKKIWKDDEIKSCKEEGLFDSESQRTSVCEGDICIDAKKDEKGATMSRSGKREFQTEGTSKISKNTHWWE